MNSFDGEAYIAYGEFTAQFIAACESAGVDIRESETPGVYEAFPYRVKIDPSDIWIDRKKASLRAAQSCSRRLSIQRLSIRRISWPSFRRLGFSPTDIPQGMKFAEYLAREDMLDPLTRREFRAEINRLLLKNSLMDKNFALCAALLVGDRLGYPTLEHGGEDTLRGWLTARKGIRVTELRKLGLSPSRITKLNARHMLRSLAELVRAAGFSGLAVAVNDLDALCQTSSLEEIRYTKMRREDAYESIRELVDAIDTLRGVMFVFAFDRRLIDDEAAGLKSYQALWARLQNEVRSERINRFADIIEMERLPGAEVR